MAMTMTDTTRVLALVRALCPAQAVEEMTAAVWHAVIDDLRVEDCIAAVRELGGRVSFISPADIRAEVRRLRRDRLDRTALPEPPVGLGDDPGAYLAWQRATTRAIADGTHVPGPAPALEARPAAVRALAGTFLTPQETRQGTPGRSDVPRGYADRIDSTGAPQKPAARDHEEVAR